MNFDLRADQIIRRLREQFHLADRRNRSQRFAAKAERHNRAKVVGSFDFAGRVSLKGQNRIVAHHPFAVVGDTNQASPAGFNVYAKARRPRINGVFDEFFDNRSGSLDDFSGGDLIGKLIW